MFQLIDDEEVARRYLGVKLTQEVYMYLDQRYGIESDSWSLKPFYLRTWFEDDLEKIHAGKFDDPGYKWIKALRRTFLYLSMEIDEMYADGDLTQTEAEALYDSIYWVYMNRKLHTSKAFLAKEESDQHVSLFLQEEPLPFS